MYALESETELSAFASLDEGFDFAAQELFESAAAKYQNYVTLISQIPSNLSLPNDDVAKLLKNMIDLKQSKLILKGSSIPNVNLI